MSTKTALKPGDLAIMCAPMVIALRHQVWAKTGEVIWSDVAVHKDELVTVLATWPGIYGPEMMIMCTTGFGWTMMGMNNLKRITVSGEDR